MIDRAIARELGGSRWALPVLAEIAARDGARFAELVRRLGVMRSTLTRTLAQMIENGWVMRNPGHGHPLRPEYLLTEQGRTLAMAAATMQQACARIDMPPQHLPRWSWPLMVELAPAARRFSELEERLAPATPRALSLTLKQLIGDDLVSRRVVEDFPPVPLYGLTERGRVLAEAE
ncbi:MAG: winged helix-turn-helix transcriptional regulator [Blastomonas sp.]